jgi:hypothetical protein
MREKNHKISVAQGLMHHAFRIVGRARTHDLGARNVRHQPVQALRMLRGIAVASAGTCEQDHRHLELAARHVVCLRRVIQQYIEANADKIDVGHIDDGPHAGDGHAGGHAENTRLRDRCVDNAMRTEPRTQALGHTENAAKREKVLTQHDDALVTFHFPHHGLAGRAIDR